MGERLELKEALRAFTSPLVLMERVISEALRLVDRAQGGAVGLLDDDELRYVCTGGSLSAHAGIGLRAEGSLAGLSVRTATTLRCDDSEIDPRVNRKTCRLVGARSMVCVPLRCGERLVGVLQVIAAEARAFDDRDVATLSGLSSFVTAAITGAAELNIATDELLSAPDMADHSDSLRDTWGMSEFIANVLQPGSAADIEAARRVEAVIAGHALSVVYQPIADLRDGRVVMAEALSRFAPEPYRAPDAWFADAWRVGLGVELELLALSSALPGLQGLPQSCRLAVNVSPPMVTRPEFATLLATVDPARLVVELTEHIAVDDYPRVRDTLASLRTSGVRLAIDDTGAGFASLSHIIKLAPDIIKLDHELVHGIDIDPVRRSLATAIVSFSADTGTEIVAEGIETEAELQVVRDLGIPLAQGYLLGAPGPVDRIRASLPMGAHP